MMRVCFRDSQVVDDDQYVEIAATDSVNVAKK